MAILNNTSVTIDTVVPTLSIGQIQLSADRRSTTTNKLTDAERIRRCVLPANHWGELSGSLNSVASQSLTDLLRTALVGIGSDYLKDKLASDPMTLSIQLSELTVSALLAWNAETASGRGSITFTRDQVEAWLTGSATLTSFKAKHHGKANLSQLVNLLTTRFATLAAKNHGLKDPADCDKLVALIDPSDLEGTSEGAALVTEIMGRIDHVRKNLAAKLAEATVSMDDL